MQQDELKFVGINDLESTEQEIVHKLAEEYFDKIKQTLQELVSVSVHTKTHHAEGKRKKYSIHIKAATPENVFVSTNASDWDIARTMHIACKECLSQIEHKLHISDRRKVGRKSERR